MRLAILLLALAPLVDAQLKTKLDSRTEKAYDAYIEKAEAGMTGAPWRDVPAGSLVIEPWGGKSPIAVPDGLLHDWVTATMAPGTTVEKAIAHLQDYDRYKQVYPDVVDARVIARDADRWRVYMKLKKKKVLTAVLNTEYDILFEPKAPGRWRILSRSTKVAELDDNKELPIGTGHGFLWRLNAYWTIEQRGSGVYLECRSISLSRDVPTGLGWLVKPMVSSVPRESLRDMLESTRRALGAR